MLSLQHREILIHWFRRAISAVHPLKYNISWFIAKAYFIDGESVSVQDYAVSIGNIVRWNGITWWITDNSRWIALMNWHQLLSQMRNRSIVICAFGPIDPAAHCHMSSNGQVNTELLDYWSKYLEVYLISVMSAHVRAVTWKCAWIYQNRNIPDWRCGAQTTHEEGLYWPLCPFCSIPLFNLENLHGLTSIKLFLVGDETQLVFVLSHPRVWFVIFVFST